MGSNLVQTGTPLTVKNYSTYPLSTDLFYDQIPTSQILGSLFCLFIGAIELLIPTDKSHYN